MRGLSHQQPPVQIGGAAVLGASAGKQLAVTGVQAVKGLVLLCLGLAAAGVALLRRGRRLMIEAGHPLEGSARE